MLLAGVVLLVASMGALLLLVVTRNSREPAAATTVSAPKTTAASPDRTIKARLFFVSADGLRLTSVERDVPFAEGAEQAREIMRAQIAPNTESLVSAVPTGTELRALFITEQGDAYVDLSREAVTAHPGGTLSELLTVYTIVNVLTVNIPAVRSVQILVEGREVQTLSGHVDLRQPLAKNLGLVQ